MTPRLQLANYFAPVHKLTLLEQTVKTTRDDPRAREALVHAYIANQDLPAARAAAEEVKTLRPQDAEGYLPCGSHRSWRSSARRKREKSATRV